MSLFLQNLDGTNRTLLSEPDGFFFPEPELSPDGSMVVFHTALFDADGGLVVAPTTGGAPRALHATPAGLADLEASWTPDGQSIVFTRYSFEVGADPQLMRVAAAGGTPAPLGHVGTSPDVRADGTVVMVGPEDVLTTFPLSGGPETPLGLVGYGPAWSPDGSEIAYSNVDQTQVRVVRANGTGDRALEASTQIGGENVEYPQWLPDGESLTYGTYGSVDSTTIYSVDRLGQRSGPLLSGSQGGDTQRYEASVSGPAATLVSGASVASRFVPVTPFRAYDSRPDQLPVTGPKTRVGAGQSVSVVLPGAPVGATAAVLNVTVVSPSASTYVTAYPTGTTPPLASTVNAPAGAVLPNNVTVKLGAGGAVSLFNAVGTADVIVDVAGFYVPASDPAGAGFASLTPRRVYDSRPAEQPQGGPKGALGPQSTVDIEIAGAAGTGVPVGATAVVVNLTGVLGSKDTLLRAYPTPASANEQLPLVSNLNLSSSTINANLAVVKIGADGKIRLRNELGSIDAILDVAGYYGPSAPGQFVPLDPVRFLDTRTGTGTAPLPLTAGQSLDLRVAGTRAIPAAATAVAANLTAVVPSAATLLRGYPATGTAVPTVSNLNVDGNEIQANAAYLVPDPTTGRVRLRNDNGTVHVLTDIAGYFTAAP